MLLTFVLTFLAGAANLLTSWLPHVILLPYGMDTALSWFMGMWYAILAKIWFMQLPWTLFLWYLTVKAGLYALKIFLGHRLPAHVH